MSIRVRRLHLNTTEASDGALSCFLRPIHPPTGQYQPSLRASAANAFTFVAGTGGKFDPKQPSAVVICLLALRSIVANVEEEGRCGLVFLIRR